MKLLVHDGFGIWCATRRLHQGGFIWPQWREKSRYFGFNTGPTPEELTPEIERMIDEQVQAV